MNDQYKVQKVCTSPTEAKWEIYLWRPRVKLGFLQGSLPAHWEYIWSCGSELAAKEYVRKCANYPHEEGQASYFNAEGQETTDRAW